MSRTPYEITVKPFAWFVVGDQVRKQSTNTEDVPFFENIRVHGVLQPLGARHDGKLVWGHRRLRAAIAAGFKEVATVILHKDMTEGEYLTLQMLENVQRAALSPYDMWQGCVRLLEANPTWQLRDVARALSLDPSSLTRIMSPSKAIPAVVDALKDGTIPIGAVYAITKSETSEDQSRLLSLALAGTSRDALEMEARKPRNQKATAEKLSRIRCPLANGTTVIVSGPEMTLEGYIAVLQLALDTGKRANREMLDVKTAQAVWAQKAKKG